MTGPSRRARRLHHDVHPNGRFQAASLYLPSARPDREPDAMTLWRSTIEHVFGTLKHWMGTTHFLTRGLEHVGIEMMPARAGLQPQAGDAGGGYCQNDECDKVGGRLSPSKPVGAAAMGRRKADSRTGWLGGGRRNSRIAHQFLRRSHTTSAGTTGSERRLTGDSSLDSRRMGLNPHRGRRVLVG